LFFLVPLFSPSSIHLISPLCLLCWLFPSHHFLDERVALVDAASGGTGVVLALRVIARVCMRYCGVVGCGGRGAGGD